MIVENALRFHLQDHDAIIVHDPQTNFTARRNNTG